MIALPARFTSAEVAANLRICPKTLRRYLAEFESIRPIPAGRDMLFTLADYEALEKAIRDKKCRSNSSRPESEKETGTTSSAARSADSAMKSLRTRATKRLLKSSRPISNSPSAKIVSLDRARR